MVFCLPEQAREYAVKRVVGLPGETIEIRDGNVFVNGAIAGRDLKEQRDVAMLVHDTTHWPDDARLPPRWRAAGDGNWRPSAVGGFRHVAAARSSAGEMPVDWLRYVHWQRSAGDPAVIEESPIRDLDTYVRRRRDG